MWGEDCAVRYLENLGWTVLERNWRYKKLGEVDIVAVEPSERNGVLVFCEVKAKRGRGYGDPLEAITRAKLARLHRLACAWMSTHEMAFDRVRIDAIGILAPKNEHWELTHVKAARL